ncbi:hypothetical protein OS493_017029 [Desmophyllum pertusum]|uniref:G-protein coupled receptors family 1 profile domain-containing protein n=1 Tax=Desmophyllum pertusum TaxID=174260 RepID=A0A9W9YNW9_9CNID|nr:hypothetical protein OS493_017029 [Desmophyllum pertusum]
MLSMQYIGLSVAFSVMVLMNFIGNSMVILVVLLNKSMRTPMNRLILNLALADMVVALFMAIQFVIGPTYQHPSGTTGSLLCKFVTGGTMAWTAATVSVCNLVAISIERYQAVVQPFSSLSNLTNRKLKFIIPICWFAGFVWNAPLFVSVTYRKDLGTCGEQWSHALLPIAYSFGWIIVAGVIPTTIMSYIYSKVVYKLWFDMTPALKSISKKIILSRKKASVAVIAVSIIYVICWVPVLLMYFVAQSSPNLVVHSPVHQILIVLAMFNSSINPVVYSFTSARFRQHLIRLLHCKSSTRRPLRGDMTMTRSK